MFVGIKKFGNLVDKVYLSSFFSFFMLILFFLAAENKNQ